jgi:hypothetical protein
VATGADRSRTAVGGADCTVAAGAISVATGRVGCRVETVIVEVGTTSSADAGWPGMNDQAAIMAAPSTHRRGISVYRRIRRRG